MADVLSPKKEQAKGEIRDWEWDVTDDLKTGVTVSSATATHTPPSGASSTATCTVASPVVSTRLGHLLVTGTHYLDVYATLSDGEISSIRFTILCTF